MKGLLIKDYRLLLMQKRLYIPFTLFGLIAAVLFSSTLIFIGSCTFIAISLTISTLSYDEFDNGYAFLFTLPITRKLYVKEKYCFGLLFAAIACALPMLICMLLSLLFSLQSMMHIALSATMVFLYCILIFSIMFPLQLRFGLEKGQLIRQGTLGCFIGVIVGASQTLTFQTITTLVSKTHFAVLFSISCCIIAALYLFSYQISVRIMHKKSF